MAFNPMALLQERQCAPIYEAIDSNRPSAALKQADAVLSSQPGNYLAAALRTLALHRTGKTQQANAALDELIKTSQVLSSVSAINALCYTLNEVGRKSDEASILDSASKAHPTSVDFGKKACLAFAYTGEWQRVQQTALRISKSVASGSGKDANISDLYFWWSMQAYSLVSEDTKLPGHQLALPLAQRMIAKHLETRPFGEASDEAVYLYVKILQKQGTATQLQAIKYLNEDETAKKLCRKAVPLSEMRRQLLEQQGQHDVLYDESVDNLLQGDRNWATVQQAVKATIALAGDGEKRSPEALADKLGGLARKFPTDRTLRLAPLYLCKEASEGAEIAQKRSTRIRDLGNLDTIIHYFHTFATKGCTFEDLEPYARKLDKDDRHKLCETLDKDAKPSPQGFANFDEMYRCMNAVKIQRRVRGCSTKSANDEAHLALELIELYKSALRLGADLPKTEMQPADDFALMAAHALLLAASYARMAGDEKWRRHYAHCAALLETALRYSPKGYRLRVSLIRVLLQFGCIDAALQHHEKLGIKAIQLETLGWVISTRAASSLLLAKPQSDLENALRKSLRQITSVWTDARRQVPPIVVKTLENGTFSRTEEMLDFGRKLDRSIARHLHTIETYRALQCGSGHTDPSGVEKEVLESISARRQGVLHDQRDRKVLLDLLPDEIVGGVFSLTSVADAAEPDSAYVDAMLDLCAASADVSDHKPLLSSDTDKASLTAAEHLLHTIAQNCAREEAVHSTALINAIEELKAVVAASSAKDGLPSLALHTLATAFEAAVLLRSKKNSIANKATVTLLQAIKDALGKLRTRETDAAWDREEQANGKDARTSLSTLLSELAITKSATNDAIADAVQTLRKGVLDAADALETRIAALGSSSQP